MTLNLKLLTGTVLSLLVLAACGGGDMGGGNPASRFGPIFAAAFAAGPNTVPTETLRITYLGLDGVSLTAEPVDF